MCILSLETSVHVLSYIELVEAFLRLRSYEEREFDAEQRDGEDRTESADKKTKTKRGARL